MEHVIRLVVLGCFLAILPGFKYIHGKAYQYLSVENCDIGEVLNLFNQVVMPFENTPRLDSWLFPGPIFVHGSSGDVGRRDNGFDKEIKTAAE